jgi:hypothetical protein
MEMFLATSKRYRLDHPDMAILSNSPEELLARELFRSDSRYPEKDTNTETVAPLDPGEENQMDPQNSCLDSRKSY